MGKLLAHVHVRDDQDVAHVFGPDDEVPEWASRKIGAHAWEDGEAPFSDDADGDGQSDRQPGEEPPRSGRGSSRDAWVAFAAEKGVTIEDGATRDQIVSALVDANVTQAN